MSEMKWVWIDDTLNGDRKLPDCTTDDKLRQEMAMSCLKVIDKTQLRSQFDGSHMAACSLHAKTDLQEKDFVQVYSKVSVVHPENGNEMTVIFPMNKDFTFKI